MKTAKLLLLVAALFGTQAIAAEPVAASDPVKKTPAAKKKVQKQKAGCVEKDGKPCPSRQSGSAAGATKPESQAKTGLENASATAAVSAPAATLVKPEPVKAEAKPETKVEVKEKTEAVLSDAEGRKLAQQSGCFMCHAIDRKMVGPAWKDVAAKYRGDANGEAKLITKVAKGGSGVWGSAPMPANAPRVGDADIKALVRFVLSLK